MIFIVRDFISGADCIIAGPYNRESYISAHVLLNLSNELGKMIKCEACQSIYQKTLKVFCNRVFGVKMLARNLRCYERYKKPETTSGVSIFKHGVISLSNAMPYDKLEICPRMPPLLRNSYSHEQNKKESFMNKDQSLWKPQV